MKNVIAFLAILMATIGAFAQDFSGQKDEVTEFEILEEGGVIVQGEHFETMEDYLTSEKFRLEGRHCSMERKMWENGVRAPLVEATSDCSSSQTVIKSQYDLSGTLTIPVVFHVLIDSNGVTGDVSDALIISQIDRLNEDFRAITGSLGENGYDTRIQFELAGITRHVNRHWHRDRRESQYKSQTGWDRNEYLNIWTNTASGYLGYAYLPQTSAGDNVDGVVLNYATVGANAPIGAPYNWGRTATHEVGHYLGLYHTFDGGCGTGYTAGDLIADTNAESTPFYGCGSRTTCGSPDPTTNYMDYSEDLCMWQFTYEQANRMNCSLQNYRATLGY